MTTPPTTYITEERLAEVGVERDRRVSPPVERGEIRRWAIAIFWPERPPPIYWDDEYAKNTRWGSIIAPPDFNPFAWPIDEAGFNLKIEHWKRQTTGGDQAESSAPSEPGTRVLNGGSRVEYFTPMRPGDIITSVSKVIDIQERQSRSVGLMIMTFTENRWTNQRGELVRVFVSTAINY